MKRKGLNIITIGSIVITVIFLSLTTSSFESVSDFQVSLEKQQSTELDSIIHRRLIKKINEVHSNKNVFSRAYIGEVYKWDVWEKPEGKRKYYECTLKEFKAQFMTMKVDFRVYPKKEVVLILNKETNKWITVNTWIAKWKKEKEAEQKK